MSRRAHVAHWMSRDVAAVGPDEPLFSALEVMAERGIRHVLVRDGAGVLLGIVSNRDVVRAAGRGGLDLHGVSAGEVMTRQPLHTTHPDASLAEAAGAMHEHKISALPVLEGGRLTGLISSDDVLAWVAQGGEGGGLHRPDL